MRLDDAPRAAWMTRLQNDMRRAVARHILREAIASGRLRISVKEASKMLEALSKVGGMSTELQQEASRWQQARAKINPRNDQEWEDYLACARKRATQVGLTTIEILERMAFLLSDDCPTCNGSRRIPWPEAGMMQDCPRCRAKP